MKEIGYGLDIMILLGLTIALLTWGGIALWRFGRDRTGNNSGLLALSLLAFGGMSLLILAIVAFPYNPKYWKIYEVSGTVESVSNVLVDSTGTLTSKPVASISGLEFDVEIDDPRAVNLEGAGVRLTCSPEFNYRAIDRVSCKIAEISRESGSFVFSK